MKFVLALAFLISTPGYATLLDCERFAGQVAAHHLEISMEEFQATRKLVWYCSAKWDPRKQEIQFSDGKEIVGVPVIIINGQCALYGSVYMTPDDQDDDREPVGAAEDCLE